jgi:hypothetical protein
MMDEANTPYQGPIPACGIYCGACPVYNREKNSCKGALDGCQKRKCKGIYQCCVDRKGLQYCYQCNNFPCSRFKSFSSRWLKYGQDLVQNQNEIKQSGIQYFISNYKNRQK